MRTRETPDGSPGDGRPAEEAPADDAALRARARELEREVATLRAAVERHEAAARDRAGRQAYRVAEALSRAKSRPAEAWRVPVEVAKLLVPWSVRRRLARGLASATRAAGIGEARLLARLGGGPGGPAPEAAPWPADRPLVSVVVICFDYGRFVAEAVDSVLAQTLDDVEVLLVEGGSTDGTTRAVVEALERPRLRKHFQPRPTSLPQNRLDALGLVRGRHVVFLDADDALAPTYLEKALLALELTGADVAYPAVQMFGRESGTWEPAPEFTLEHLARGWTIPGVAMFSVETWQRLGIGYATHVRAVEDWDFWLRFAERGATGRPVREPLMRYRKHGTTMSESLRFEKEEQERRVLAEHARWLGPVRIARVSEQQRRAMDGPAPDLERLARASRGGPGWGVAVGASGLPAAARVALEALAGLGDREDGASGPGRRRAEGGPPEAGPLVLATGPDRTPWPTVEALSARTPDVFDLAAFLDPGHRARGAATLLRRRGVRLLLALPGALDALGMPLAVPGLRVRPLVLPGVEEAARSPGAVGVATTAAEAAELTRAGVAAERLLIVGQGDEARAVARLSTLVSADAPS